MRTKTKQNISLVLSTALPKAPRKIRETNSSLSCWELETEVDQIIITWGKGGETTEKQGEKTHRKLSSQVYILLFQNTT